MPVYVTKPFLPPKEQFLKKVSEIFDRNVLTNQGPNVQEFEQKMRDYLNVKNFHYVTNGTIALQLALRGIGITEGEVITTPFSYVATVSSILWERCTPVFVDIESDNFTIDPDKIESAITSDTRAIMPVHVFGYACDVDKIEKIARKHSLKVIYDAAHTFGSFYKGKALSSYGDISTLSFHATKLFHTIEGGACIVKDQDVSSKIDLMMRFGHNAYQHLMLGINAKQDEFNAAMGLANFEFISEIIKDRKNNSELYDYYLKGRLQRPKKQEGLKYNYAYYPVLFDSEKELLKTVSNMEKKGIYVRRYFYPSLNNLHYLKIKFSCPVAEDVSKRIVCLPLFYDMSEDLIRKICENI